jgi:hypothetical protein
VPTGRSLSRLLLYEADELDRNGAPTIVKARFSLLVSIGDVLVHHVGDMVGAGWMVLQRYDRGHEGLFGKPPSAGQGIREELRRQRARQPHPGK